MEQIYDEFEEVKNNILKMYAKYDFGKFHFEENYFVSIMKSMYFIKDYLIGKEESYYNKSVIYDSFRIIDSFRIDSITNYHQCFRSLMENVLRSILELSDDDAMGVNNLFSKVEDKFKTEPKLIDILLYIKGAYGKSCDFIHSNIKSNIKKELFFSDFLKNEKISKARSIMNIEAYETFLKKYIHLIIISDSSTVENVFYRKKPLLYRLVGKEEYDIFEKMIKPKTK